MKNKTILKLIVCLGPANIIGDKNPVGNGMLWYSKEELKYYKDMTVGNVTLFGKKTANVVPVELMKKNREVIILQRDTNINEILKKYEGTGKVVYICGGLAIYEYFLKNFHIDELLISKLKSHIKIETARDPLYFPDVKKYNYSLKEILEYDDFIVEKYIK